MSTMPTGPPLNHLLDNLSRHYKTIILCLSIKLVNKHANRYYSSGKTIYYKIRNKDRIGIQEYYDKLT